MQMCAGAEWAGPARTEQHNRIVGWGGGSEVLNRGLRKIWKEDKVCHKVLLFTVSFADKHATKTVCI